MLARILSAEIVLLLVLTIGWLFYFIFIASVRYLSAVIDSLFRVNFGMILLCRKNLTVFAIHCALVFFGYTR